VKTNTLLARNRFGNVTSLAAYDDIRGNESRKCLLRLDEKLIHN